MKETIKIERKLTADQIREERIGEIEERLGELEKDVLEVRNLMIDIRKKLVEKEKTQKTTKGKSKQDDADKGDSNSQEKVPKD